MVDKAKAILWGGIKKKLKIRSWEDFKARSKRYWDKKIYTKTYNTTELVDLLKKLGIQKGSTVFLHSSWNEFYNFQNSPTELINAILNEIGPEGTLAMPAYPLLRKPDSIFNIKSTPTAAGIIPETFRNYSGVVRSVNRHSVCALGPNADFLTKDHINSVTSWDENSPYYKLGQIEGLILTMGLGSSFVGTVMHVADSMLRKELPYFAQFFTKEVELKFKLPDNQVYTQLSLVADEGFNYDFTDRHHSKIINQYFDKSKFVRTKLSNLTVNKYEAKYFIDRSIELGRKGIVVYTKPDPKKYNFSTKNNYLCALI